MGAVYGAVYYGVLCIIFHRKCIAGKEQKTEAEVETFLLTLRVSIIIIIMIMNHNHNNDVKL